MAMEKAGSSAGPSDENNEEDPAISMLDVLREEEELEADANAVLGDSDATNCTYLMGYVPRQALYACMTCNTKDPTGVCLACSYECHDGHDLVELYTKRNFKCDCGNGKFKDQACKLFQKKSKFNTENRYNHNFKSLYCICDRPYPDPDDDIDDEMIQCIICEDWYHGRHLGLDDLPETSSDSEMVCQGCMRKHDFLWAYNVQTLEVKNVSGPETSDDQKVDVGSPKKQGSSKSHEKKMKVESPTKNQKNKAPESPTKNKEKTLTKGNKRDKQEEECLFRQLMKRDIKHEDTAAFFSAGWRKKLCTCTDCMKMYSDSNVEYLPDESDTVAAYELRGKQKSTPSSQYDKGLQALSNMDRLQQVEVLHGYNDLKSELNEYLKKFAQNKKVVREEDIREFFSAMEARKKRKTSSSTGMSYFCK